MSPRLFDWDLSNDILGYVIHALPVRKLHVRDNSWQGMQTWRDVEVSSPLSDFGVLVLPQLLAVVQHHRGALVHHAKLVGIHRHTGHPLHTGVKGGNGVPQLAGKGQDKAPQTGVHMQQEVVPPCHLHMKLTVSCRTTRDMLFRLVSHSCNCHIQ